MAKAGRKRPNPFKFNSAWLVEEEFINLIKEKWAPYNGLLRESACI
jgi:hypothetical protein